MSELGLAKTAPTPVERLEAEVDLLKRYLRKDHEYRQGVWDVRKRAIIYDNLSLQYGVGQSAYSNLSALVGSNNIDAGNYFDPALTQSSTSANRSYLWGWANAFGEDPTKFDHSVQYTPDGGGAADFLSSATSPDIVFNQLFGSFIADWHHPNNFLRSAIAGPGHTLTSSSVVGSSWKAQYWHMGMGETAGDNLLFTQKSQPMFEPIPTGGYFLQGAADRSTALMGDPTLRMAVVKPPTSVYAVPESNGTATVEWAASADESVVGYRVYQAASVDGPFTRISGTGYVTGTSFPVSASAFSGVVYMVRAFKLETSNTGTYYNASQGAFSQVQTGMVVGIGERSRAFEDSVSLTFNQPVNLSDAAVTVMKRGSSTPLDISVSTDDDGLSYVITLLDDDGSGFEDGGVFDVSVSLTEVTLAGTPTTLAESDYPHMFFRLAGDADGNGTVNFSDFLIFQTELGGQGGHAADSDGNGLVDLVDFQAIQINFNVTLVL